MDLTDSTLKVCVTAGSQIDVYGTPGKDLGIFLNGPEIRVFGNGQDSVGNTVSSGRIIVDRSCGHMAAMSARGGRLFIRGNAGPRAAVHMKQFGAKKAVVVIGGSAAPFLGEYRGGGVVVVLNMAGESCASFPVETIAAGIHGGLVFHRGPLDRDTVWGGALIDHPTPDEQSELRSTFLEYCGCFPGVFDFESVFNSKYAPTRIA
ncbi:MAG: hypothetical protein HPY55_16185 [Firmicutes bacterium]|nr:hypothetical protein [Bacillota bacterium]